MKKLIAIIITVLVFTGASPLTQNEVSAKTTCKTYSKYKKVCYYYKGTSKTYYKRVTTIKHKNMKYRYREYVYRTDKGIKTSVKRYYYNKRGQLKSNKYGNAYRKYYTYFSNNKVAKYYKHKYKSNGKLARIYYKYYSNNKPKPAVKKPTVPTATELSKMNDDIISMVNAERSKRGIATLKKESRLQKGAEIRAKELTICFNHVRPNKPEKCGVWNESFSTIYNEVGYNRISSGENIHMRSNSDYNYSAKAVYDEFYKSEGHRNAMLDNKVKDVGVYFYYDKTVNKLYVVQLFGAE